MGDVGLPGLVTSYLRLSSLTHSTRQVGTNLFAFELDPISRQPLAICTGRVEASWNLFKVSLSLSLALLLFDFSLALSFFSLPLALSLAEFLFLFPLFKASLPIARSRAVSHFPLTLSLSKVQGPDYSPHSPPSGGDTFCSARHRLRGFTRGFGRDLQVAAGLFPLFYPGLSPPEWEQIVFSNRPDLYHTPPESIFRRYKRRG